jgi:tRNA(Ile)-lysidine synthase
MDDVFRRTGVDILRPFLGIPRRRIEAFLHAQGQSWLDDPSNDDGRFERVRVRRALRAMPSLGLSPVALALSARRLRRARDALEAATTAFLSAHATLHLAGFAHIGLPHLFEAHEEVGLRALNRMIATVGGDSSAPLRLSKLEACFETLRTARRGATLGGCRLLVKGSALLIIREIGRMDATAERPMLPGGTCLWDARFIVTYGADEPYSAILRPLGADGYRAIKVANGHFGGVPRLAALTLPSLWAAGALRYAPFADFAGGSPAEWSAHSRAQFVNALAVPAARDEDHDRC